VTLAPTESLLSKLDGRPPEAIVAEWEREIPMRRLGRVEEFANTVAFLCSERASYVTGVSLSVDGGWNRSLF